VGLRSTAGTTSTIWRMQLAISLKQGDARRSSFILSTRVPLLHSQLISTAAYCLVLAQALDAAAVLYNLNVPKGNDPLTRKIVQPVQFAPDTSRAGGR